MIRSRIVTWLISISVPFILVTGAIRLLISPIFLELEYRAPGFPADSYGLNLEERLHWSKIAADYLLNSADISFLEDLKFPDGSPLYNTRELSHMEDVKHLVKGTLLAWYIIIGAVTIYAFWSWERGKFHIFLKALVNGGKVTIILVLSILLGVVLSFNELFTGFHQIFFEGNTWIFLYSDTLIRLFPMRFWQDAFMWIGIIILISATVCILIGWVFGKKITPPS